MPDHQNRRSAIKNILVGSAALGSSSMLTSWKKQEELDFLNEVSCVPLQQSLRHWQTAFTNFFAVVLGILTLRKNIKEEV